MTLIRMDIPRSLDAVLMSNSECAIELAMSNVQCAIVGVTKLSGKTEAKITHFFRNTLENASIANC